MEYSIDYVLICKKSFSNDLTSNHFFVVLDKLDESLEWFSLVIGYILDSTVNAVDELPTEN